MHYCKSCGVKLDPDNVFCPKCGTPVGNTDQSKSHEASSDKTVKRASDVYGAVRLDNIPAGYIIDNRYEIKRKLGQGGFGAVYLAYDRKMEVEKALKVIPEVVASDRESMKQLHREAKIMIKLNHPNIVRVYDFNDEGGIKYIDMEYVDGKTLTDLKLEHPDEKLPEAEVVNYAIKIAEAFEYAHRKDILHRDIKPQNVMVTSEGEVKVMDFGIAETVRSSMTRLTGVSSSGTLAYMSPEQLRGKEVGKESDIYSFGAMLYDLLSGHPPFYRGNIDYQIINEKPEIIEDVSDWVNTFVQNCLQKNYRDRPGDFSKLLKLLNLDEKERQYTCQKCGKQIKRSCQACSYCGYSTEGDYQPVVEEKQEDINVPVDNESYKDTDNRRNGGFRPRVLIAVFILLAVIISIIWYSVEESNRREEISSIEEEQRLEEIRRSEAEARIAEEERQAEQAQRAEENQMSEEVRNVLEERIDEETHYAEEARRAEEELRHAPVTDIDGNVYEVVIIGDQVWMAENLRVTRYRNDDSIPNITDNIDWSNQVTGAWSYHGNDESIDETYGKLYNWYAVADPRGLCPEGWRIPSDADWKQIEMYLGMGQKEANKSGRRGTDEGGKMKSTQRWLNPNTGATNESSWSGLPGGLRYANGSFLPLGSDGVWWSSTEFSPASAWARSLNYNDSYIGRNSANKASGYSVRCVRN